MTKSADAFEKSLSAHAAIVEARLATLLDASIRPAELARPTQLIEAMHYGALNGGKRLRPAFAYWGYRGAGGEDSAEVVAAVAALELVQASALIHDDVMDASDTRRGEPAVHRRYELLHRSSGWSGDAKGFGAGAAILLGDLCLAWSDELLRRPTLDAIAEARERGASYEDIINIRNNSNATVGKAFRMYYTGYSVKDELPILLANFLVPGVVAVIAAWQLSRAA